MALLPGQPVLRVRGRRSGRIRSVCIRPVEVDGRRYLVALLGDTHWVRDLGASGMASRCGRAEAPLHEGHPARPPRLTGRQGVPGRTAGIKAAFAAMGGHGTCYSEVRDVSTRDCVTGRICSVGDDAKLFDQPGGLAIGIVDPPLDRDYLGTDRSGDFALIGSVLDGKPSTASVRVKAVSDIRPAPGPAPDCTAAAAAERERIATAELAVIRN
jgi:hypothetical protein